MPTKKYSYAFYTNTFPPLIAMNMVKQNMVLTRRTKMITWQAV